jgi:hypothetical protein
MEAAKTPVRPLLRLLKPRSGRSGGMPSAAVLAAHQSRSVTDRLRAVPWGSSSDAAASPGSR